MTGFVIIPSGIPSRPRPGPLNKFGARGGSGITRSLLAEITFRMVSWLSRVLFERFSLAGAEVRARTPTLFSEVLDGWRRAWVRWTTPEEARDRDRENLGFVSRV